VTLRYRLSRLSQPASRRAFGRVWLAVCLTGAFVTLGLVGGRHVFIVLTLWLVCAFAPVRIAVELLHTVGPRLRGTLRQELARRDDRYATRERATLMAEMLFDREVRLPRLAPPELEAKVVEAAVGICERAVRRGGAAIGVLQAAVTCAALLDRWVGTIGSGEAASDGAAPPTLWDARASIQDQWVTLRAVVGLAALTETLVAVYEDSAGRPMDGGAAVRAAADAAMDYADQVGLRLDGPPWSDVPGVPRAALPGDLVASLAETWTAFCAAPQPAPRRLRAFLDAVPD